MLSCHGMHLVCVTTLLVYMHGRPQGGQEGALAPPPRKFTDMGAPPPKDNLTRNLKKKLRGPHIVSEETALGGEETDLRGAPL